VSHIYEIDKITGTIGNEKSVSHVSYSASSVAIEGGKAIIGIKEYRSSLAGAILTYQLDEATREWNLTNKIKLSNPYSYSYLGGSVGISGNTIIGGATGYPVDNQTKGRAFFYDL